MGTGGLNSRVGLSGEPEAVGLPAAIGGVGSHFTQGSGVSATSASWDSEASFTAVAAGYRHSCGLRTDGSITCWGDDEFGQASPPSGSFTAVTAGGHHSCGLRTDGTITCWGHT